MAALGYVLIYVVAVGVGILGMFRAMKVTLQCRLALVPCAKTHMFVFIEAPLHLSVGNHWPTCDHHPIHKGKLNQQSVTSTDMSPWSPFSSCRSYLDNQHWTYHVLFM